MLQDPRSMQDVCQLTIIGRAILNSNYGSKSLRPSSISVRHKDGAVCIVIHILTHTTSNRVRVSTP